MSKPLIAVDIDEVLANTMEAVRHYINRVSGSSLTREHYNIPGPYWNYFETVWRENGITDLTLIDSYHQQMAKNQGDIMPMEGAVEVVKSLRNDYKLIVVSSREKFMKQASMEWINRHFDDAFSDVIFIGHAKSARQTKGEVCVKAGASLLIDDNFEHCQSAVDAGLSALVFGKYGWHLHDTNEIPGAHDWAGVRTFLDGSD